VCEALFASLTLIANNNQQNIKQQKEREEIFNRDIKKRKKSRDDENDENSREIFVPSGDALQLHLLVFLSSLVLFVENAARSWSDEQSGSV
jgi:hypothetical protein